MAGRKKKASPKGHPRLKPCPGCQVLNAPRTFFCKECNHPFYSEEYMASRLDRKRSDPFKSGGDESESIPPTPSVVKPNVLAVDEFVDRIKMVPEVSSCYILGNLKKSTPKSPIALQMMVGNDISTFSLFEHSFHVIDEKMEPLMIAKKNLLINAGGRVESLSFNPTNEFLVTLVGRKRILCWHIPSQKLVGKIDFMPVDDFIKSINFCANFASDTVIGILAMTRTDRVDLILLENSSPQATLNYRVVFTTLNVFEDAFFPTGVDLRFLDDSIELVISNNLSSFVFYLRLSDGLTVSSFRSFGYNHVVNKANLDGQSSGLSSASSIQSTCVCFMRTNANFFFAGYSVGTVGLWDIRNTTSPVQIMTNNIGTRRYLLGVKSSWTDSRIGFAAFQSGSILELDPSSEDAADVLSIGGDVRNAQCCDIDSVDTRAFVAMNSGVVLTLDVSLRGKLRRPLTSYVCQWEAFSLESEGDEQASSGDAMIVEGSSIEEKLLAEIEEEKMTKRIGNLYCKFFPTPKIPNNLKLLKASDGASNEGFPSIADGAIPVAIKCIESTADGLVAYGNDAGIVHIFRSG